MAEASYKFEWSKLSFADSAKDMGKDARKMIRHLADLLSRTEDVERKKTIARFGKVAQEMEATFRAWETVCPKDDVGGAFDAILGDSED